MMFHQIVLQRNQCQITCSSVTQTHVLQLRRQCEVVGNCAKQVWSLIVLSLQSLGRGEASGRRGRTGHFFILGQGCAQVEEHRLRTGP